MGGPVLFWGEYKFDDAGAATITYFEDATFGTRLEELIHHVQVQDLRKQGKTREQIIKMRKSIETECTRILQTYGFERSL